jgi:glycosidase
VNSWDGTEYERLGPLALPFAVLTALLPGMPLLYSGQEAGLNRRLEFFERDTIDWNEYPLQDFYMRLFQLKQRHPALRNGDHAGHFLRLPGPPEVYSFCRTKGAAAVLCVVNTGAEACAVPSVPGQWHDVFSDETLTLWAGEELLVPAHGWRVLVASEPAAG